MEDTLLKKPDVIKILKIGRNKLYDIITVMISQMSHLAF